MEATQGQCLHSRMIPALVDINIDDEKYTSLIGHIQDCQECSDLYKKCLDNMDELTQMIPKVNIPRDLQMKFESQTSNFVRATFPQQPDFKEKTLKTSANVLTDLFKALTSKQFIIVAVIGVAIIGLSKVI